MLSTLPVPVARAADKEATYAEMQALGAQIESLKASPAGPVLGALLSRYRELSAQMGGDDPAHLLGGHGARVQILPRAHLGGGPPPGCAASSSSFTNGTPLAIPTGPAVVSTTLVVSGAGAYLLDLNLTTFITHTFAADLDITLMSPAGTVVTLTTDNGAGNDNVFNGTVWDDDANPGGQVPYTTNNGLATDNAYVNLVLASPLVPEESLGAFIGEDPNGTWTITISDDLAGDGGSLASWTLDFSTLPAAPTTTTATYTNSTPLAIPTGPAVVSSTLNVPGGANAIFKLTAQTNITHTFAADLDITLLSPAGTVVTLTTDNGAGNDNVFNGTVWDDDANPGGQVPYTTNPGLATDHPYVNLTLASPLEPEEAMGAFIGETPAGDWTITISDDLAGDGGSLASWSLTFTTGTCFTKGDFNSDGKTDILFRHANSGKNVVWYMDGITRTAGVFTNPDQLPDTNWSMVGTNDFSSPQDSKTDIVFRHGISGKNVVWYMDGITRTAGVFTNPDTLADTNWRVVGTGDFSSPLDGKPDFLFRHAITGKNVVWYMDGITRTAGVFTNPDQLADTNWFMVGIDDFWSAGGGQDGKSDILWRHNFSGKNVLWYMDGITRTAGVFTSPDQLPDTNWRMSAVGDYSSPRDSKPDILFRHQISGRNVVWYMDGATRTGGVFTNPDQLSDTYWKIVGPR